MMRRRRIRYIGEPAMPLTNDFPRAVLFVGRESTSGTAWVERKIVGTAFLINVPSEQHPHIGHLYAVTAGHVVEGDAPSFVRVPTEGGLVDLDVPDWVPHPGQHDVAVAPIVLPAGEQCSFTNISNFIDDDRWRSVDNDFGRPFDPELGDTVYFIGLLGKIEAMSEGNIPMVRAGTLGRLWQDRLPVQRTPADEVKYVTAHLIDCRSFAGFSGAPCYLQQDQAGTQAAPNGNLNIVTWERTALLGLIGGHFDDWEKTRDPHAEGYGGGISDDLEARVSTGVGYVIPAEFIRETLMVEELVEARRRDDETIAARSEEAATMDSTESEPSEFERFEDLTRGLVNVPKKEVDAKRRNEGV